MLRVLSIEKTFVGLREIVYFPARTAPHPQEGKDSLYGNLDTIKVWSNYGQYNENRIKLISNGKDDTISLNGFQIHNIIKDIHYFQNSRDDADTHRFTIEGRDNEGRLFENEFFIKGHDILPAVVYAIILLTQMKNSDLTKQYWKALNEPYRFNSFLSLEEKMTLLIKIKRLAENVIQTYPFMESFFQNGIGEMIKICKSELDNYNILKL